MKACKIGIMGGTFDPIHIGHLILGENAYQQFGLDEVWFMPSGNPPHKRDRLGGATNDQRVEMVRRAIAGNPHFRLSLEEMHEEGYTYTRETLERLNREHPECEYYFIMGADSLRDFHSWRDPEKICRLCVIVAAIRDHMPQDELDERIRSLKELFGGDIRKLSTMNIDISSKMIREWVQTGRSCRYYVPDPVIDYITEHHIYYSGDIFQTEQER